MTPRPFFLLVFIFFGYAFAKAQTQETPVAPYIKTIEFKGNTQFGLLPIVQLGSPITLSFDDIIGDEADYFYTITHHDADWKESRLARAEFMNGMDNVRILDYTNSLTTLQLYSHYTLRIPNRNVKALTKTGNYILHIFNEDREEVFSRKFMIYQPQFAVGVQIKRSRDLSYVNKQQVVRFFIDSGDTPIINPKNSLTTVILQNNNLKSAITGLDPQYILGNKLEYRYDRELAFWAGNEFYNFENKDLLAVSNMVSHVEVKSLYHHHLYTNASRFYREYTYDPDINGNFLITSTQARDVRNEAEYVWVHFAVDALKVGEDQEIHVTGNFNNYELNDETQLAWDPVKQVYTRPLLLKQGFYDYRYVITDKDRKVSGEHKISGDFWQTENEYQVLVYYRRPGGRFDELLGIGSANSNTITN